MQSAPRERLLQFSHLLQGVLFERLEQEVGPLGERAQRLVSVLGMIQLGSQIAPSQGCRAKDRHALAAAFLAKAVYGLGTTRQVRESLETDRQLPFLCGWREAQQIPHESTFLRAFAEFAQSELPQRLHQALIRETQQDRLVGHIARDSTAIEARERFDTEPAAAASASRAAAQRE